MEGERKINCGDINTRIFITFIQNLSKVLFKLLNILFDIFFFLTIIPSISQVKYNFNFRKGEEASLRNRYNFERYSISNFLHIIKWYANSHDTGHDNYRPLIQEKQVTVVTRLPVRTCREKWIERRICGEIGSCSLNGSFPSGLIHLERKK